MSGASWAKAIASNFGNFGSSKGGVTEWLQDEENTTSWRENQQEIELHRLCVGAAS